MATNRWYGALTTAEDKGDADIFGLPAAVISELKVEGRLSESGAASDYDFAEDYSSTATFAAWKATAECVITKMVLEISLSTFTGSAVQDLTLWLGGTAQLTNGITWGVSSVGTATAAPDKLVSSAAKSIAEFSSVHGAEIIRDKYSVDATAGDNHDAVIVTYEFEELFGCPIRLGKNNFIGIRLRDDFASTAAVTTFTGKVFGRFIYK